MAEPLTRHLVADVLDELVTALPPRRALDDPEKLVDVYRNGLAGLSGDAIRWAVKRVIQQDEYFPKVSRLRQLAEGFMRTTTAVVQFPGDGHRWDVCHICGAKVQDVPITRPKGRWIDAYRWRYDRDDEGRLVMETVAFPKMLHDRQGHRIYERPGDPT